MCVLPPPPPNPFQMKIRYTDRLYNVFMYVHTNLLIGEDDLKFLLEEFMNHSVHLGDELYHIGSAQNKVSLRIRPVRPSRLDTNTHTHTQTLALIIIHTMQLHKHHCT